ncbi:Cof-type HAD-IIB family hydrolase [Collinsella tanakaei]|uniref:Cof-type HAD-IIB family hydrolase n=1 Tax=Collinsella tanakaei TaxID=626935 RepID=UPI0025A3A9D9|nr:Cof-type HAD-IIB family hydrolase [Collinsella tanakaei]MDM8301962.1 Cof-type HAD-IIB family hydrolase [Collinsella tanakaei]
MDLAHTHDIRIVFTDVDGTLLDAEHRVIPEACPTVQALVGRGVPFVLVSARMPEGLTTIQRAMGFSGPLICYGGAYVLDEEGNELLSHPIDLETAYEIKEFLDKKFPHLCCSEYGFHTWACDDDSDPRIQNEERITTLKAQRADMRTAFDERGIHKFLLMGDPDDIECAERDIAQAYPQLTVARSSATLCEVTSGAASKAEGVEVVCDHFGISIDNAVAFGDGRNDIDMLVAVPNSYAMANAPEEVIMHATHVTDYSNTENGVALTLMELMMNHQ